MPQAFPEQADRWEEADVVMGNSNRSYLLEHILAFMSSRQRIVDIAPHQSGEDVYKRQPPLPRQNRRPQQLIDTFSSFSPIKKYSSQAALFA